MRRIICALMACCIMLGGCAKLSYVQVRLVVHAMGIDVDEQSGGYKVSYQVFSPDKSSGGGPTDASVTNTRTLVMAGKTLYEAEKNLELQTGREAYFGNLELIVIGKSMAQRDFKDLLGYFYGSTDIYMGTNVVFSSSDATDVISATISKGTIAAQTLRESVNAANEASATSAARIIDISNALSERSRSIVIPAVTVAQGKTEESSTIANVLYGVYSSVLVKDGKGEAAISRSCSKGLRILNASANSMTLSIEAGESIATVSVDRIKIDRRISIENGYPMVDVEVSGVVTVNDNPDDILDEVIRQAAQQKMLELCELAYSEIAVKTGADVFDIAKMLRKYEAKYYAKTAEIFDEVVKNTLFNVEIKLKTC